MLTLSTSVKELNKVGAVIARQLKSLEIETVEDLLFYFPFRYDDFSLTTKIKNLQPKTNANIVGHIELMQNKRSPRKKINITEAIVSDDSGSARIIWFNQPFIGKSLGVGDKVSLSGRVEEDYTGAFLNSPNYEKVSANKPAAHTQGLVPNYHLTANLTQKQIRFLISQVINLCAKIKEWLPEEIKNNLGLISFGEAIQNIHFPTGVKKLQEARRRLAFDELFLIQLRSQSAQKDFLKSISFPISFKEKETKSLVESLPFQLTNAQKIAAWEILKDLGKDHPITRLLEGDVGSGKTIVALIAMFNAALNNFQSALMAPTEILASQHFDSLGKFLSQTEIKIALLTRTKQKILIKNQLDELTKKELLKLIKGGEADIIIGTHALIQESVEFKNLALVIVDEQHRFGVDQRKNLLEKSGDLKIVPHLLSMTATPIPRSLALALYGDLEISFIKEMPKGRKPIITKIVEENKREACYEFISAQVKSGRQVFVICPLIDPSDKLGVKSVKEEFERLDKLIFKNLKIALLHGKLKSAEKEKIMQDFLEKKIDILVSTSVVEVGVDIPNASIMLIEGADRFGLSQLHQFRGRVGRGEYQSYCFLFTESNNEKTLERLNILVKSEDGFALAEADLKMRGPGEVYGTMQKGFLELKMASLLDYNLMNLSKKAVLKLLEEDASLAKWPALKEKFSQINQSIHLE